MKAETKLRVAACAAGFALPRYNDLPSVGLYLDQTVQFVNGYFRSFCGVELTPSMVSNYVKKGVVDHPIRKKYTRDQIASLMYIAVSKTVLSMENIDALFKMQRAHCSAGAAYDYFCDEMENCLPFVFGVTDDAFLHIVAHHGGGELHPGEIPEIAVDELDGLVQIQPNLGQVTVPGQGKACGTGRDAAVQFLFHAVSIAHFKMRVNGKTKTF